MYRVCQSKTKMEKQTENNIKYIILLKNKKRELFTRAPEDPSLLCTCAMELHTGVYVGSFSSPEQMRHQ